MKENKEKKDMELSTALSNFACLNIFNKKIRSISFWCHFTTILL